MTSLHDIAIRGNIVQQARVLTGGWLAVTGDVVSGLFGAHERPRARTIIDATDSWVLPGGVDAHVHSRSSRDAPEGFDRLTATAALGGVTTVVDMPYDGNEPVWNVERLAAKIASVVHEARVDVALFGTVEPGAGGWQQVVPLALEGVCGLKLSTYETDPVRFPKVPDDVILRVFEEAEKVDLTVAFHAENGEIIDPLIAEHRHRGETAPEAHCWSRPPVAETTAVVKLLELVRNTAVKLHIVHLTVPSAFELLPWYRGHGVDVTAETCMHYLVLDETHLRSHRGYAKCNPPLRSLGVQRGLWRHLLAGDVAFVTSDHVPWPEAAKAHGNIFDNASGLPGVGQLLPLLFSYGVARRGLSIIDFARLTATNPARRYGLYPRKGALLVGGDADIVIIDPSRNTIVDTSASPSEAKWSPYNGLELDGEIVATWVRGSLVHDRGRVVADAGYGQFLRPVGRRHGRHESPHPTPRTPRASGPA